MGIPNFAALFVVLRRYTIIAALVIALNPVARVVAAISAAVAFGTGLWIKYGIAKANALGREVSDNEFDIGVNIAQLESKLRKVSELSEAAVRARERLATAQFRQLSPSLTP